MGLFTFAGVLPLTNYIWHFILVCILSTTSVYFIVRQLLSMTVYIKCNLRVLLCYWNEFYGTHRRSLVLNDFTMYEYIWNKKWNKNIQIVNHSHHVFHTVDKATLIARFMGPTWGRNMSMNVNTNGTSFIHWFELRRWWGTVVSYTTGREYRRE